MSKEIFTKIMDKIDEIYNKMEKEIPFTKSYNELSERKGKLLQTLHTLEREGLIKQSIKT